MQMVLVDEVTDDVERVFNRHVNHVTSLKSRSFPKLIFEWMLCYLNYHPEESGMCNHCRTYDRAWCDRVPNRTVEWSGEAMCMYVMLAFSSSEQTETKVYNTDYIDNNPIIEWLRFIEHLPLDYFDYRFSRKLNIIFYVWKEACLRLIRCGFRPLFANGDALISGWLRARLLFLVDWNSWRRWLFAHSSPPSGKRYSGSVGELGDSKILRQKTKMINNYIVVKQTVRSLSVRLGPLKNGIRLPAIAWSTWRICFFFSPKKLLRQPILYWNCKVVISFAIAVHRKLTDPTLYIVELSVGFQFYWHSWRWHQFVWSL